MVISAYLPFLRVRLFRKSYFAFFYDMLSRKNTIRQKSYHKHYIVSLPFCSSFPVVTVIVNWPETGECWDLILLWTHEYVAIKQMHASPVRDTESATWKILPWTQALLRALVLGLLQWTVATDIVSFFVNNDNISGNWNHDHMLKIFDL